jgi:hypothetical protein
MTRVKIFVHFLIALTLFCAFTEGQNLKRRRIQRQQKQFEEQKELSNQQSQSPTLVRFFFDVLSKNKCLSSFFIFCFIQINSDPEKTSQIPINHAIIESIFDVSIE